MKHKKRIALLLSFLMTAACWAACGSQPEEPADISQPEPEQSDGSAAEPEETEAETVLVCSVPEDLTLGGETVSVLSYRDGDASLQISAEEQTGDVFNDALFGANLKTTEEMDFVYRFIDNGGLENDTLVKSIAAGDEAYDIVYGTQWKVIQLVLQNRFANLDSGTGESYIDLDKPWWYSRYIAESKVDNEHTFFLAGDASPDIMRWSSMLLLNTDMLADFNIDKDSFYEMVLDGKWTFDELFGVVEKVRVDADGDGEYTEKDIYGFGEYTYSSGAHFLFDSGIRATDRDENGYPFFILKNERTVDAYERIFRLFYEQEGVYYVPGGPTLEMFGNGQLLLLSAKFYFLDSLRDSETNYSVIPMPKLDLSVERYSSLAHNACLVLCVPIISTKVGNMTAVMEKTAYHYYYDVMPTYYEIVLKTKYRRDSSEASAQILDVVHDSLMTDFAYFYSHSLGNIISNINIILGGQDLNFASSYDKNARAYEKALSKLIDALQKGP